MSEEKRDRVLVVEDDDNLRELVSHRLERNDYEVQTAADGYTALDKVQTFRPNVVILDLMIPKLDGYAVCRMLKSSGRYGQVKIIIFSARISPDDIMRGEEMGADAFLHKPFNADEMLGKMHELLHPGEEAPAAPASEPGPPTPEPGTAVPPAEPVEVAPRPEAPAPEPRPPTPSSEPPEPSPEPEPPRETVTPSQRELDDRVRPSEKKAPPKKPKADAAPSQEKKESFFSRLFRRLFKPM